MTPNDRIDLLILTHCLHLWWVVAAATNSSYCPLKSSEPWLNIVRIHAAHIIEFRVSHHLKGVAPVTAFTILIVREAKLSAIIIGRSINFTKTPTSLIILLRIVVFFTVTIFAQFSQIRGRVRRVMNECTATHCLLQTEQIDLIKRLFVYSFIIMLNILYFFLWCRSWRRRALFITFFIHNVWNHSQIIWALEKTTILADWF